MTNPSASRPRTRRNAGDPPGVAARRAALRLLDAVLRRGLPLESALDRATAGLAKREDRALAHAVAAETLRRLADLDALIDSATRQRLPDDAKARFVLRIALVQALALGVAQHAAIATALPLVDGGPRKLVHGVFGTLMRGDATLPEPPTLPAAVVERWGDAWGAETVAAAAQRIARPPPRDLTLRDRGETEHWCSTLGGTSLIPGHVRMDADAPVTDLPGFADGAWWVQDLAASLPARLAGPGRGNALDLCAAPGGKTLQLAAAGWRVSAVDVSESRLARLRDNCTRTGLAAEPVVADITAWAPDAPADLVLLDAPCSATGIFGRHPDVLHRVRPAMISDMAELQTALIARAADWVRPGGTLILATCSLEPAEGEDQLAAFLDARSDYAIAPVGANELPAGIAPAGGGWVRTLPTMLADCGGLDGFFIARLKRAG